jgi:DNA-binding transcriptional LysR family regulator
MATPDTRHSRHSLARTLKLQQLVIFEKVVQSGSILAASRELAMTQPAVSKAIHELERRLGGTLFVRGKRGVVLSEFGLEFEQHAKSMLADLRHLADGLNAWQSGASGQLIVGTLLTASATLLPDAITRLLDAAPDIKIEVMVGSNANLFPALARGELDIVVGFVPTTPTPVPQPPEDAPRLTHVKLYDEALCAVVAADHPIRQRRRLKLRDLHGLRWILPTPDSVAYTTACAIFERQDLALPASVVHSVSLLTNLGLLTRTPTVALMPQSAAEPFVKAGMLAVLPLGPLGNFGTVGYTVRADRQRGAALARLIEALQDVGGTRPSRR